MEGPEALVVFLNDGAFLLHLNKQHGNYSVYAKAFEPRQSFAITCRTFFKICQTLCWTLFIGSGGPLFMAVLLLALLWFYNTGANSSTAMSSLSGGHMTPDNSQETSVMDAKYLS